MTLPSLPPFLAGISPVVGVIVIVSLYAAYVFFDRLQKLRRADVDPSALLAQVRADLLAGNLAAAVADAHRVGTPAARVIEAGLERAPLGDQAVEAALNAASATEEERVSRGLTTLSTVAQIAPLLGLLGTVFGMIRAFGVLSASGQPSLADLAFSISEALVATASGLVVAVLAYVGHNYLARRSESALTKVERARQELTGLLFESRALALSHGSVTPRFPPVGRMVAEPVGPGQA